MALVMIEMMTPQAHNAKMPTSWGKSCQSVCAQWCIRDKIRFKIRFQSVGIKSDSKSHQTQIRSAPATHFPPQLIDHVSDRTFWLHGVTTNGVVAQVEYLEPLLFEGDIIVITSKFHPLIECGFHESVWHANAATTISQGAQLKEKTVDPWHYVGHLSTNGGGHVEPHILTRAIGAATDLTWTPPSPCLDVHGIEQHNCFFHIASKAFRSSDLAVHVLFGPFPDIPGIKDKRTLTKHTPKNVAKQLECC